MRKSRRAVAGVIAICALGLVAQGSLVAATAQANVSRLHCGEHKFATGIKISGPSNEIHPNSCNTAFDMFDKGKLSDDRTNFSSPGWDCGRGSGFAAFTWFCTKGRLLVEFNLKR
jgi:hypothetical protein